MLAQPDREGRWLERKVGSWVLVLNSELLQVAAGGVGLARWGLVLQGPGQVRLLIS